MLLVEHIMSPQPIHSVRPADKLWKAEHLMQKHNIRHLAVVTNVGLVGLLSQRDLLKRGFSKLRHLDDGQKREFIEQTSVEQIMTKVIHVCHATDHAARAGEMMLLHKYSCLPVVEGKMNIVGMVTESDFVRWVVGSNNVPYEEMDPYDRN